MSHKIVKITRKINIIGIIRNLLKLEVKYLPLYFFGNIIKTRNG